MDVCISKAIRHLNTIISSASEAFLISLLLDFPFLPMLVFFRHPFPLASKSICCRQHLIGKPERPHQSLCQSKALSNGTVAEQSDGSLSFFATSLTSIRYRYHLSPTRENAVPVFPIRPCSFASQLYYIYWLPSVRIWERDCLDVNPKQ